MKKALLIGLAAMAMAGTGGAYAIDGTAQGHPVVSAAAQQQTTFAI